MLRRIIFLFTVLAILVLSFAVPAFAVSDVEKPPEGFNFGKCHKLINSQGVLPDIGPIDNSGFNAIYDPWDPRPDKGNPRNGVACSLP
jgi:hypothetical protein